VEYKPQTTEWECRTGDCNIRMTTKKHIPRRRRTRRREYNIGPNEQDIASPYFRKTLSAKKNLLIHLELAPQGWNRNMEICPQLRRKDTPGEKWIKILHRALGNMPGLRLQPRKYPYRYHEAKQTKPQERIRGNKQNLQRKEKQGETP